MNGIHSVTCIASCKEKGRGEGRGIPVILALLGSLFSWGSRFLEWQPTSLEKLRVADDTKDTSLKNLSWVGMPIQEGKKNVGGTRTRGSSEGLG